MARTRNRALAKGIMTPRSAVCYASLLGAVGMAILWTAANRLAAGIVLTGFAIYVGVYTLYLKRRSVYATMIGSLTGAAPPLAGYCAFRNGFDMGALILLAIFGSWQVPHSYAIAIFRFNDYAAAAIPVLPVERGTSAAKRHIVGYILVFMVASSMLTFAGYTGYRYLGAAAVLGLCWLFLAWSGYKTADDRLWARRMFVFSIVAIFGLSIMMSIDFAMPGPSGLPDAVSLLTGMCAGFS